MRRADRLFQLVHLLRARRFATGDQLARELGVSVRTVYRDVRDLGSSGVPIRGEAGVGYRLERGFELPPLTFTSAELESLVLGARMVRTWGDGDLRAAVGTAMAKIEAVLPEALRRVVGETALFAPSFPSTERASHELATLRRAISERRLVHFRYTREDGIGSERSARPLGLYFWGRSWTLAAWCELRQDYRSFRPDRMSGVSLLETAFDPEDGIDLRGFLDRADADAGARNEAARDAHTACGGAASP